GGSNPDLPDLNSEDEGGQAQGHHNEPNHTAHQPGELLAPLLVPGGEWVADAQVALDADAGEEHDAAVQVGVELETHEPAGEVAEGPVVLLRVVVDEEGQRAHVQQVGRGQVQHVDGGAGQRLLGHPDLPDDDELLRGNCPCARFYPMGSES
uniref:Uncharacterized protein n=1 Tax=Crocodylus porosus TaxID=8502 RepID=A0A7M4FIE8_CROPO